MADPSPRAPARIILAEDDDQMRKLVADALRKDGHEVVEAADGHRLLVEVISKRSRATLVGVDLIVSDIRMPMNSGLQVVAALRDAACTTPVILMTAFGDDETRAQAESLGALLFDKPFLLGDLRDAVKKLVAA